MKKLLSDVSALSLAEYNRASAKFGERNNSHHESYAVILEEFEEAIEEECGFQQNLERLWEEIKSNKTDCLSDRLTSMRKHAEHAAAEWIQVAAMCYKAGK